jgi:hypothetical protein
MASSGFNPNLHSASGAQGVAQFLPEVWRQHVPTATSPLDPTVAIPALGKAMCDLVAQFTGLGEDPYASALTAFHWGPTALRLAGDAGMQEFATAVIGYADYYAHDSRLGGTPAPAPTAAGANPLAGPPPPAPADPAAGPLPAGPLEWPPAPQQPAPYQPAPAQPAQPAPAQPAAPRPVQPQPAPPPAPPPAKPIVNLALHRNVVASSFQDTTYPPHQNFPAYLAVDGNGGTRWSSLAQNPTWIYVDLGSVRNVVGCRLVWETAYSKNYEIRVSNDAQNWITVYQNTSGDGGTDAIKFTPVNARYVKMYSVQRAISLYGVSLWEFEVFGN